MFRLTSHPSRPSSPRGVAARRRRLVRAGQSLVEFAILLPVFLLLVGVTIDFARLYQGWTNLEAATRDAAQYLATSDSDSIDPSYTVPGATADSTNDAKAKFVLDSATGKTFARSNAATLGSCSSPTMTTVTQPLDSTAGGGGSPAHPVQKVEVLACVPFRTLFAYPLFTINGDWILRSDRTYSVIVGL